MVHLKERSTGCYSLEVSNLHHCLFIQSLRQLSHLPKAFYWISCQCVFSKVKEINSHSWVFSLQPKKQTLLSYSTGLFMHDDRSLWQTASWRLPRKDESKWTRKREWETLIELVHLSRMWLEPEACWRVFANNETLSWHQVSITVTFAVVSLEKDRCPGEGLVWRGSFRARPEWKKLH